LQKINIIAVGTLKEKYWKDAQSEYIKRLNPFCCIRVVECSEPNTDIKTKLSQEAREIMHNISKGFTVLLDIDGMSMSSQDIAKLIDKSTQNTDTINFIIGGSNGVAPQLFGYANQRVSLGKITLPHQLCRVVLLEQIYRGFSIIHNKSYHK